MYKLARQELIDWKQQEKRLQSKLSLRCSNITGGGGGRGGGGGVGGVGGRGQGGLKKVTTRTSVSCLLDEKLAQENLETVKENEKKIKTEKAKGRPSVRFQGGGGMEMTAATAVGVAAEIADPMKAFKDQIQAMRKKRKEMKLTPSTRDRESDEEDENDGDEEDNW
jgi:hypothetical protein